MLILVLYKALVQMVKNTRLSKNNSDKNIMIYKKDIKPGAEFWFFNDGFIRELPRKVHIDYILENIIFFDEYINEQKYASLIIIDDLYYSKKDAYIALAKCIKARENGKNIYLFLPESEINRIKRENVEFFL